jgi:hypothetical protein
VAAVVSPYFDMAPSKNGPDVGGKRAGPVFDVGTSLALPYGDACPDELDDADGCVAP